MRPQTRAAAIALVITAACTAPPSEVKPSPPPGPSAAPTVLAPSMIWTYTGTLLPPRDPATYENALIDAKPLSDGGWIVLRAVDPRRFLVDPTVYGGGFGKQTYGELLKLDASGRIVAKEHAAEPLGLTKVDVFEEARIVVAQGRQVRNGTVHALRLDSLDGVASELTNCIAINGRCWSYRTSRSQGPTALEERDPRTLAVLRRYPQLTMDGLNAQPAIFPTANLIAWQKATSNAPATTRGVRAEALDPSRPVTVPWVDRLRQACDAVRVGDDRVWVEYGPTGCDGADQTALWTSELVEVSTGKVLRRIGSDEGVSGNELAAGRLVLGPVPLSIDPRSGLLGPNIPDHAIALDFDRGIAVLPLTGGGSAVLRRQAGVARPSAVLFTTTTMGRCRDVDFPTVLSGPADFACSDLSVHVGPRQVLVATGRNYRSPVDFDITDVAVDAATRELEIAYHATARAQRPMESGPVKVIELSNSPAAGEWLVRVSGDGRGLTSAVTSGTPSTFVVRFP